ncbi:hypothetical protein D5085_13205 [Ectothiorhodospiraceae bacterium BW-2]|nr:hypothetical protein D5085_13205 [Ectothiorhodospiraceae bacterium BW-2]
MQQSDLLIGIDLGTAKTSLVTNRQHQVSFSSVVGYPRDLIGVRLLGESHIVGSDALGKSYLDLVYPLENGLLKEGGERERDAARRLFVHIVEQADIKEGERLCAVIGVPAGASKVNRRMVLDLAREHFDISLVMSQPFLSAYAIEKLTNAIVIDFGAGTIDLCAMKGHVPRSGDQVSLIRAGNEIDAIFAESVAVRYPQTQMSQSMARQIKERFSFVKRTNSERVMVTLREEGRPVEVDVTDELRQACESLLPELLEQTEKLIATFSPDDQAEAVANVILTGGGSRIRGLADAIADGLQAYGEVGVTTMDDVLFNGCLGALKLASELPPDYWEQMGEVALRSN